MIRGCGEVFKKEVRMSIMKEFIAKVASYTYAYFVQLVEPRWALTLPRAFRPRSQEGGL